MPRTLTQYRVFIGSPGGLEEEREKFQLILEKHTKLSAEPDGHTFHAVVGEDTLAGVGRPQELILRDLETCQYAIFIFHERWGSKTGAGDLCGTEEEFNLAKRLYDQKKLWNIVLLFKDVEAHRLRQPDDQLLRVLDFQKKIKQEVLFKSYSNVEKLCEILEAHWPNGQEDIGMQQETKKRAKLCKVY